MLNPRLKEAFDKIDENNFINLIGLENYENFYENCIKSKESIKKIMGNNLKIFFKVEKDFMEEESERLFRQEFRSFLKNKYGITKTFFSVASCITESSLLKNSFKNGMKFTKKVRLVLKEDGISEDIIDDIILNYSMIKNSFIMPDSYLVVSIDPIDFLYMGVGKGWGTCYSPNNGSHFTGALSSGLDKVSFLTYFTTTIGDPSKKIYRRLGVFSEDYSGLILSTQYPYKNNLFETFTISTLQNLFFKNDDTTVLRNNKNIKGYKKLSSQVFNDFVSSSSSKRESLYIGAPKEKEIIHYGEIVKCLICGTNKAMDSMPVCESCLEDKTIKKEILKWEICI